MEKDQNTTPLPLRNRVAGGLHQRLMDGLAIPRSADALERIALALERLVIILEGEGHP